MPKVKIINKTRFDELENAINDFIKDKCVMSVTHNSFLYPEGAISHTAIILYEDYTSGGLFNEPN